MTDDRTPHLFLPLPHPHNDLSEDVLRLRDALSEIDEKFSSLDDLLQSDDTTLDQVQELVSAIKENRSTITDLLSSKASQSDLSALQGRVSSLESVQLVEETIVLEEDQQQIDLAVLTSTEGAEVYVEGVRLKASDWTPDPMVPTRLELNKTYPAGHEVTVVRRQQGGV